MYRISTPHCVWAADKLDHRASPASSSFNDAAGSLVAKWGREEDTEECEEEKGMVTDESK